MSEPCGKCGRDDGEHEWQEGDCLLPHKTHSTRLIDNGLVCVGCVDRHRDWVAEIVELFQNLHLVLLPGSVPDSTADHKRPKKAPEAPVPVRLEVLAMLADRDRLRRTGNDSDLPDVPAVITGWAGSLHENLYGTDKAFSFSAAGAFLQANAEAMARQPDVDEFDAELRWVRSHLRRAHGRTAPKPAGRCPSLDGNGIECGGGLWPDETGRMQVSCSRCERVYGETYLRHLGQMLTDRAS